MHIGSQQWQSQATPSILISLCCSRALTYGLQPNKFRCRWKVRLFSFARQKINTMNTTESDGERWSKKTKWRRRKRKKISPWTHWKHIKISIKLLETISFFPCNSSRPAREFWSSITLTRWEQTDASECKRMKEKIYRNLHLPRIKQNMRQRVKNRYLCCVARHKLFDTHIYLLHFRMAFRLPRYGYC